LNGGVKNDEMEGVVVLCIWLMCDRLRVLTRYLSEEWRLKLNWKKKCGVN